jgi:hypothetical protein
MTYLKQQDKMRLITDIIAELDSGSKLRNLAVGSKGEWLLQEEHDPNDIWISKFYQRQFSVNALNSYKQFDKSLARPVVIAIRPKSLGGRKTCIDGQHTTGLAVYSSDIEKIPCLVLRHPENASLIECIEVESKLFHAYNTARKNPTAIDKYRAGLCFDDPESVRFNDILEACNLQIDGLGDLHGDELASAGAARLIKTIEQFAEDYRAYIPRAVNFIRRHWGSKTPSFKYRDDFIHGLTTLFVFLDEGRDRKGSKLNGKKDAVLYWMEHKMPQNGIQMYVQNTGGGNTHYKIVHKIIEFYNSQADVNKKISSEYLHINGIWDANVIETRRQRLGAVGNGIYLTANFPDYDD